MHDDPRDHFPEACDEDHAAVEVTQAAVLPACASRAFHSDPHLRRSVHPVPVVTRIARASAVLVMGGMGGGERHVRRSWGGASATEENNDDGAPRPNTTPRVVTPINLLAAGLAAPALAPHKPPQRRAAATALRRSGG